MSCDCGGHAGPCQCPPSGTAPGYGTGISVPFRPGRQSMAGFVGFGRPVAELHPDKMFRATAPAVETHLHHMYPYEGSMRSTSGDPVDGGHMLDVQPPHVGYMFAAGRPR